MTYDDYYFASGQALADYEAEEAAAAAAYAEQEAFEAERDAALVILAFCKRVHFDAELGRLLDFVDALSGPSDGHCMCCGIKLSADEVREYRDGCHSCVAYAADHAIGCAVCGAPTIPAEPVCVVC